MSRAKFGAEVQAASKRDWFYFCANLLFSGLMLACSDSRAGLGPQANLARSYFYSEFTPAKMENQSANFSMTNGNSGFLLLSGDHSALLKPTVNAANLGRDMPIAVAAPFSRSVSLSLEFWAVPTILNPLPLSKNEFGIVRRTGISHEQSQAYAGLDAISPGKRISPIPLPTTAWMFLTGLMGVLAICKCRKP